MQHEVTSDTQKSSIKHTLLIILVVIMLGLTAGITVPRVWFNDSGVTPAVTEQLIPTYVWMNFYSPQSTLDGEPLPVGSAVRAYDAQGVLCGQFTVTTAGHYGLMPVYHDDPTTPIDEGAVPGDPIRFTVDDVPAKTSPETVLWTELADLLQVDLAASLQPRPQGNYQEARLR